MQRALRISESLVNDLASSHRGRRRRASMRLLAVASAVSVCFWSPSARAINALFSQDLPVLSEIAMTEAAILGEASALVAQAYQTYQTINEHVGIAKAVHQGVQELTELTWDDLKGYALEGLSNTFPEIGEMYSGIHDMADFRKVNYRSVETVRGMLWANIYGPAVEGLHQQHENMEASARSKDHRARSSALIDGIQKEIDAYQKECDKGEGACSAAASRAQMRTASLVADMHKTTLQQLELQEREILSKDAAKMNERYAMLRWLEDLQEHIQIVNGEGGKDCAGHCLYDRYAGERSRVLGKWREQHRDRD